MIKLGQGKILGILIASFLSQAASAQDSTRKISLPEAIQLAVKNSPGLALSKARIAEATAVLQEANDARLPDLNISGSYLRLNSANIDLKTSRDSGASGPGIKINQALYGSANLALPIYAGGRIRYGIQSAKYLKEAGELDAAHDRSAVIMNCIGAYVNLYKSSEAVKLVQENLRSSLSRDTTFSNLERNGLLAKNDLLKSKLQTAKIELSLLDALSNHKLAMVNTNILLGLDEATILIVDTSFLAGLKDPANFPDMENEALLQRKDVQAIAARQKAAAASVKSAKGNAYPSLALTGGYVAAYVPNLVTVTNALNIGIGVRYNLASLYKKNSAMAEAKARREQLVASEQILKNQVRSSINKDYQDYLLSKKKISLYETAVEQATENYRITKNKYDNSLVTLTELLDADVELLQAKLNIEFAKADLVLSYNRLLQTSGTLIE